MLETIVELRHIDRTFETRAVLIDVQWQIHRGDCYYLRGINGAGKSTLLRIIATLLYPSAGELQLFGKPAWPASGLLRRRLGILQQPAPFTPSLTVAENLELFAALYQQTNRAWLDELVQLLGLEAEQSHWPAQLSQGYQKRLQLALCLLHRPELLLLDEPFDGIDSQTVAKVIELLGKLHQAGTTVIIVSHQESWLQGLTYQTAELIRGHLQCR